MSSWCVTHATDMCTHGRHYNETKTEQYIRQSERARADIATWPKWMQRNLKPTSVPMYICTQCNEGMHNHEPNKCPATWTDSTCGCRQGINMNDGSTLRLVLMDNFNKIYYTEPFSFSRHSQKTFEDAYGAFRDGCTDALKDIERDVRDTDALKQFTDHALKMALQKRGYKVTLKEDYPEY